MKLRSASTTNHEHAERLTDCEVRTRTDDEKIGHVSDLLVDESGRICYLDVHREADDEHVLLPTGNTRFEPENDVVWIYGVTSSAMRSVPTHDRRPEEIDRDYERRVSGAYDEAYDEDRYYDRPEYDSAAWNSGRTPSAQRDTDNEATRERGRLERLDRIDDYEVADHEHDPRGWDLVGRGGTVIGEIDHLIGDTGAMKVRYLVADLDDDLIDEDREILIPVGHARLEPDEEIVRVDGLSRENVAHLPAYTGDEIDRDYERKLHRAWGDAYGEEDYHRHPRHREEGLVGGRRGARTEKETTGVRQTT